MTRDSFEMQLESIKGELEDTIGEVKSTIAVDDPRLDEAEKLIRKPGEHDLAQEARDIGVAMKMLREVMKEYKRADF